MSIPKIKHAYQGDRVLLTAELPKASVTAADDGTIEITLDSEDWADLGKLAFRARQHAERDMDPEILRRRVLRSILLAAHHALHAGQDPVVARRRAVGFVLHHLADMVTAGTIVDLDVQWWPLAHPPELEVQCETRGGKRVEETIALVMREVVPR
ncbi:MAG TPA: hypothetical protein VLB44_01205 [Kofleriaceae bacterium]|nr:hypothetical protein [Kofleriaceae bacterium]